MFLAVYSHYMVSDPFERSGPALVFTFMLVGRLVIWYQVRLIIHFIPISIIIITSLIDSQTSRREAADAAATQTAANGVKQD